MKNSILGAALALCCSLLAVGTQAQEVEPNDTCAAAQDLAIGGLPFNLEAELGVDVPDVDFFFVAAPPGDLVQFDLQGASNGSGTLGDPVLGLFDALTCDVISTDDDSGDGANARLIITMPEIGGIIVGASQFPDFSFTQGGVGSYVLSVVRLHVISSISAQLVDGETFAPLAGDMDPSANASLATCNADGCFNFVSFAQADTNGFIRFDRDFFGNPLTEGSYLIQAGANGYNLGTAGPFAVGADEHFDAGEVALSPISFAGMMSGRVVDARSGEPLSGATDPFARVLIERCLDPTFCYGAAFAYPDEAGRFQIDSRLYGLPPGDYRVMGQAENYLPSTTGIVTVGNREDVDFGDVAIMPVPVRLTNVTPCELPAGGGTCKFGADVVNVGPGNFKGKAWASIESFGPDGFTRFQVGRNGTHNPQAIPVHVGAGHTKTVQFQLTIPSSAPDGGFACGTIWLGERPWPEFNLTAQQFAFCVAKTSSGLATMNPHSGRKMLLEKRRATKSAEPQVQKMQRR